MQIHRNVRLLAWFNFCHDFRPYAPIAIIYFSQISGSFALGMSIFSIVMLTQSLCEVPTGVFSDMIGRKKTLLLGAAASVLSLTFYAIGGAYWALLIGAFFEGLGRAFFSGNNDALLYDSLAEVNAQSRFQEFMGKTSSMYQLALAISAVLGSFTAAFSFQLVLWLSVIPHILSLIVAAQFTEPRAHLHTTTNVYAHLGTAFFNIMRNPRLRTISVASILSFAIGESSWQFRSAFIGSLWPVWAIGLSQMIANASAAVSFYFAGCIIKRFGEFRLLIGGMAFSETLNIFALALSSVISPVLMSVNSIFFGVNTVASGSLMQHEFSDEQRSTMGSLTSFGGSIAFTVFSFALGALADRVGAPTALICASLLSIVPIFLYSRGLRRQSVQHGVVTENT